MSRHISARCIITGCALIDTEQGRQVHGDLHQLDDSYIFNACVNQVGEAAWEYDTSTNSRAIYVANYFERRGVIVFSIIAASFNQAAEDYLTKAGRN